VTGRRSTAVALVAICLSALGCTRQREEAPTIKVVFVCEHGSAKSVVAARQLARLAAGRGLRIQAVARGVRPDERIADAARAGLRSDGLDAGDEAPRALSSDDLRGAAVVVSFGQDVSALAGPTPVERWDDAPAVSEDYARARDYIVGHERALLDAMAHPAPR